MIHHKRIQSFEPIDSNHEHLSPLRTAPAPARDLVGFDRLEQGLEVSLAEAVIALALDELEEDRPDHRLGEDLQQDARSATVDDALAVDQDAVSAQPVEGFAMALHPVNREVVINVRRRRHELQAAPGDRFGSGVDVLGADGDVLDALAPVLLQIFLDLALVVGAFVDRYADLAALLDASIPAEFDIPEPDADQALAEDEDPLDEEPGSDAGG